MKICAKPPSKNQKRPLPVDVRCSKTLLLKLPIIPAMAEVSLFPFRKLCFLYYSAQSIEMEYCCPLVLELNETVVHSRSLPSL